MPTEDTARQSVWLATTNYGQRTSQNNLASPQSEEYASKFFVPWFQQEYTAIDDSFFKIFGKKVETRFSSEKKSPSSVRRKMKMSEPTREEIDAKLAAVEARLEARLVGIDGKLDRISDSLLTVTSKSQEAKEAADRASSAASSVKWNILFTALAVLGVIAAMWAIWAQGIEMVSGILGVKS